ncbi:MAG: hypothetical protein RI958_1454 [Actinomycetota bacterium]
MHAPERLWGLRVVSTPEALDAARYTGDVTVLQIAADEVLALDAAHVELDDPYAIIEPESTFVKWTLTYDEFDHHLVRHIEWQLPSARPALAQGLVAGMPVKLWLTDDHVDLIVSNGLVHEAVDRLGVRA